MPSSTPAQLGLAIRDLRAGRDMSIEALAMEAGIHTTYLSGIEHGRRNPSWKVVGALADVLEVKISDLARAAEKTRQA